MWTLLEENSNYEISQDGDVRNVKTKKIRKYLSVGSKGTYELYKNGKRQNIGRKKLLDKYCPHYVIPEPLLSLVKQVIKENKLTQTQIEEIYETKL